jgi:hypothetical protein
MVVIGIPGDRERDLRERERERERETGQRVWGKCNGGSLRKALTLP